MTLNQKQPKKRIKLCGVYKITSPNNRVYIGSSSDITNRFSYYRNGHCKTQWILKRSFDKYGIDNHKFEILEICEPEIRLKRERYYGEIHKSISDFGGLNLKLPSYEDLPPVYSQELRNKFSEIAKNRKYSEDTIRKFSIAKKGKYLNGLHHMAKIVLNVETGIYYECIKEAAKSININRSTLSMQLTGKNKNSTSFIYA